MPYIIFVTTPYLISAFIGNFNNFNIIYLLTEGKPQAIGGYKAGGTDLLVTWLFKLSVDEKEYNLGAVIGIMTFLCTSIITLVTYRNTKAYKEEDAFQ
jgi:arabinogalactan oligomer/maltooligosaccharide transport system permease protein